MAAQPVPQLWTPPGYDRDAVVHKALAALAKGREGPADDSANRRIARLRRLGSSPTVSLSSGRNVDPMFYWRQSHLPHELDKPEELKKVRDWCRHLYLTHPVFGAAVDIFSQFPLVGMEIRCKDPELAEFYQTLFLGEEQLNYKAYLVRVLREYWVTGESWPFGTFHELLGVWETDELLDPDDIEVTQSPFMASPLLRMRLPKAIRDLIQSRDPLWEYERLIRSYPEFATMSTDEKLLPVSGVLLKQLKHDMDTFNPRGVPIMLRGLRPAISEEKLHAAQDAIADRLYTPLILAKLGASASDLGTERPWIPSEADLADFEEALDAALAGDFRALIHHFACDITSVFGREAMPRLGDDFDRLTERILMVFGLSKTMLAGASGGQTYAADALNRDLVSQMLVGAQDLVQAFFRDRARVVAEAQEHYDYVERSGKRYPVMEEVLEVDEETGEQHIVEQPKLLVPELIIRKANLRDEEQQRVFYEALRAAGVPISMRSRTVNVPIDLDEEREQVIQEQVDNAVAAQEARKRTYLELLTRGLPIPEDLKADFQPKVEAPHQPAAAPGQHPGLPGNGQDPNAEAVNGRLPSVGLDTPADDSALVPDPYADVKATDPSVVRLPRLRILHNPGVQDRQRQRPPESDEQRRDMPKPAGLLAGGPRHIGMRRYATVLALPDEEETP